GAGRVVTGWRGGSLGSLCGWWSPGTWISRGGPGPGSLWRTAPSPGRSSRPAGSPHGWASGPRRSCTRLGRLLADGGARSARGLRLGGALHLVRADDLAVLVDDLVPLTVAAVASHGVPSFFVGARLPDRRAQVTSGGLG